MRLRIIPQELVAVTHRRPLAHVADRSLHSHNRKSTVSSAAVLQEGPKRKPNKVVAFEQLALGRFGRSGLRHSEVGDALALQQLRGGLVALDDGRVVAGEVGRRQCGAVVCVVVGAARGGRGASARPLSSFCMMR